MLKNKVFGQAEGGIVMVTRTSGEQGKAEGQGGIRELYLRSGNS